MEECESCEGFWGGRGCCDKCGAWDACYYRFCFSEPRSDEEMLQFAADMRNNPLVIALADRKP